MTYIHLTRSIFIGAECEGEIHSTIAVESPIETTAARFEQLKNKDQYKILKWIEKKFWGWEPVGFSQVLESPQ